MTPKRIQLSRKKGWRLPANTVIVSRPSPFGNIFRTEGMTGSPWARRLQATADFLWWLEHTDPGRELLARARRDLRGKNLACWCPIGEPCHADVLLEAVNS